MTNVSDAPRPTEQGIIAIVRQAGVFPRDTTLQVEEIGDGNINYVYRVRSQTNSLIVKQATPFLRIAGADYPLSINRAAIEADALAVMGELIPAHVPRLVFHDPAQGVTVMEDLAPLPVMRRAMLTMHRFPLFADHISTALSILAFHTSDFVSAERKRLLASRLVNTQLSAISDSLIFTAPYFDDPQNRVQPKLRPYLERHFWQREDVRLAAAEMKRRFQTGSECVQHGDLHTGSIFANAERTVLFDPEFAFVGPTGFDIGKLIGNLIINYFCWSGRDADAEAVASYRTHLIELIENSYSRMEEKLIALMRAETTDPMAKSESCRRVFLETLRSDMIGFAATSMIRRMFGLAQTEDVEGIVDLERRRDVQITVLELASKLLLARQRIKHISEVIELICASAR
jgi:5-methylthioribose kinase